MEHAYNRPTPPQYQPSRAGTYVLWGIAMLALLMGVFGYRMYAISETHLSATVAQMKERGKELSVDECVMETLSWTKRCEAMKSLCDASVTRVMGACLAGQDRAAYCQSQGENAFAKTFGQKECESLIDIKDRKIRKICGNTYSAISFYCGNQGRKKE